MARIMVVDDMIGEAQSIAYYYKWHDGHDTCDYMDIGSAMENLPLFNPDIVITDKNIGGHRGVEPLLNRLQTEYPHTKVLMVSGEDGRRARKELYCHDYLEKPLKTEDVTNAINRLLK